MPFFSIRIGSKYKQYRKQRFCCVKISRTVLNNTRAEVYCTTTTQPSREANNIRNFASRCNRMHFDVVRAKQSYIRGAHIKFRIQFLSFSQNQHFASHLFRKTSVVSREQSIVKKNSAMLQSNMCGVVDQFSSKKTASGYSGENPVVKFRTNFLLLVIHAVLSVHHSYFRNFEVSLPLISIVPQEMQSDRFVVMSR